MIKLTDELAIMADKNQYIIGKPTARARRGTPSQEMGNPRYFTTLGQTIRYAVSTALLAEVEDGTITDLRQWLKEYRIITERFSQTLEPLDEKQ